MRVAQVADVMTDIFKSVGLERQLSKIAQQLVAFLAGAVSCGEPTVLVECNGDKEALSSKVMICHPHMYLAETEADNVPLAVFVLYKVAVADALNDNRRRVAVCQHRVVGIALELAPDAFAACVGYHVTILSAALCCHEIIILADLVHMGAFKVSSARALPYTSAFGELFACFNIYLALNNAALALAVGAVADEEGSAVLEIKRGVNAVLVDGDGVRPFAVDIIGVNVEIPVSGVVGRYHVKSAVVVADSGRKNSA